MPLLRKPELKPVWSTADGTTVKLYHGDVVDVLRKLPAASVHTVCTSPPYWGLRSYLQDGHEHKGFEIGSEPSPDCGAALGKLPAQFVLKVVTEVLQGAEEYRPEFQAKIITDLLIAAQVKREPCGRCFVCKMVEVFREVRRVLRDDGTLWLNLGDTYGGYSESRDPKEATAGVQGYDGAFARRVGQSSNDGTATSPGVKSGLKSGNLVGIPWRVALALQADGWILRQDVIWSKPSPMPESVKNRCTKSHEYIFLLVKRMGYYYDAEAIKDESDTADLPPRKLGKKQEQTEFDGKINHNEDHARAVLELVPTRNKRSVWRVSSQGYEGAHFATFPEKLIEPCILAGTSAHGCCVACGAPWRRVVNESRENTRPGLDMKPGHDEVYGSHLKNRQLLTTKTIGWEPTCECHGKFVKSKGTRLGYGSYHDHNADGEQYGLIQDGQTFKGSLEKGYERPLKEFDTTVVEYVSDLPLDKHPVQPCTVLDPFCGSGTTNCVALAHGQRSIGIDLSLDYIRANAIPRIEGELIKRGAANLSGRPMKRVDVGEPA